MHGIVSLLDEPHYLQVQDLWRSLETECGLDEILLTPMPHFSWHLAANYDFASLEKILVEVVAETKPFTVYTSGLGVFSGPAPVVYISVVKPIALAEFHQRLWDRVNPVAREASPFYDPSAWVPHITLAYGDVSQPSLCCALEMLAFKEFRWEIRVDHLASVYQDVGEVGKLQNKFTFGG
jgi:2'-5' RNA ligase